MYVLIYEMCIYEMFTVLLITSVIPVVAKVTDTEMLLYVYPKWKWTQTIVSAQVMDH